MDLFDKFKKKASETYKVTAEKTGKIAKETKLKLKISDLKSSVQDVYEEIGKKVYEKHELGKKSVSFDSDLKDQIKKLEELSAEIVKLNNECLELQDKIKCPSCDKEIKKDSKFCPNCGENLEKKNTTKKTKTTTRKENVAKNKAQESKEKAKSTAQKAKADLEKTVKVESGVKTTIKKQNTKK